MKEDMWCGDCGELGVVWCGVVWCGESCGYGEYW